VRRYRRQNYRRADKKFRILPDYRLEPRPVSAHIAIDVKLTITDGEGGKVVAPSVRRAANDNFITSDVLKRAPK
jgi:hypothetical protein